MIKNNWGTCLGLADELKHGLRICSDVVKQVISPREVGLPHLLVELAAKKVAPPHWTRQVGLLHYSPSGGVVLHLCARRVGVMEDAPPPLYLRVG